MSAGSSTAITEMSGTEISGAEDLPVYCEVCGSEVVSEKCELCASLDGNPLGTVMLKALNKIDKLTHHVQSLESGLAHHSRRLSRLEINSEAESGGEPSSHHGHQQTSWLSKQAKEQEEQG